VAQAGAANAIGTGYMVQVYTANDQVRDYLARLTTAPPAGPTRIAAGTPGDPMTQEEEAELKAYVDAKKEVLASINDIPDPLKGVFEEVVKGGLKFAVVPSNNPSDKYQLRLGEKEAFGNVFDDTFVITKEAFELMGDPTAPPVVAKMISKANRHEKAELDVLDKKAAPEDQEDQRVYAHLRGLMAELDPGESIPLHIVRWLDSLVGRGDWTTINNLYNNTNDKIAQLNRNVFLNKDPETKRFAINLAKQIQAYLLNYQRSMAIAVDGLRIFLGDYINKVESKSVAGNIVTLVNKDGKKLELKVEEYGDNVALKIGNQTYMIRGKKGIDISKVNPLGNPEYLDFFGTAIENVPMQYINFALPVDDPARMHPADVIPVNPLQQPELFVKDQYDPAVVQSARDVLSEVPVDVNKLDKRDVMNVLHAIAIVGIQGAATKAENAKDYYEAQALLQELIKATDKKQNPDLYNAMVGLSDHMLFSYVGCDWLHWQKLSARLEEENEAVKAGVAKKAVSAKTFLELPPDGLEIVDVEVPDVKELKRMAESGDIFKLGEAAIVADKGVAQMPMAGGASSTVRGLTGFNKLVHAALKVKVAIAGKVETIEKWISIFQARVGLIFGQNPKTKVYPITSVSGAEYAESDRELRTTLAKDYPAEMDAGQIRVAIQRLGLCLNPKTGYPLRFSNGHVTTAAENHLWALMPVLMDKDLLVDLLNTTNGIVSIGNGDNILNYTRPGMVGALLDARDRGKPLATVALCSPPAGDKKCGVALKITYLDKNTGKKYTRLEFRETSEFPTRNADFGYGAVVIAKDDPRYAEYEKKGLFIEDMLKDKAFPVNVAFYAVDLKLIIAKMLGITGALKDMKDQDIIDRLQNTTNDEWIGKALDIAYKARVVPVPAKKVYNEDGTELRTGWLEERAIQNFIVNGLRGVNEELEAEMLVTDRGGVFLPYKGTPQDILDADGNKITDRKVIEPILDANRVFGDKVVKDGKNQEGQVYDLIANMKLYASVVDRLKKQNIDIKLGDKEAVIEVDPVMSLREIIDAQKLKPAETDLAYKKARTKRAIEDAFAGISVEEDRGSIYPAVMQRLDIDSETGEIDKYAPNKVLDLYFSVRITDNQTGRPVSVDTMPDDMFFKNMNFFLYVYDETEKTLIDTIDAKKLVQVVGRNPVTDLYDGITGDQDGMKRFRIRFDFPLLTRLFRKNMTMGVHDLNVKIKMVSPNGVSYLVALAPYTNANPYGNLLLKKLFVPQRLGVNPTRGGNPQLLTKQISEYLNTGARESLSALTALLEMEVSAYEMGQQPADKLSEQDKGILMDRKGAFADAVGTILTAQNFMKKEVPVLPLLLTAMNEMGKSERATLVEKALPAYVAGLKTKPAADLTDNDKAGLAYAEELLALAKAAGDVSKNAVAGVQLSIDPALGEAEVSGQTVAFPEAVKKMVAETGFNRLAVDGKAASAETLQQLLMELATRRQILESDPLLKKLMELTQKPDVEQLNISLNLIAEYDRSLNSIRNRGVGFAKILKKLAEMGVHVNIVSDLDEALTQEILAKSEGIDKDTIGKINQAGKGQVAIVPNADTADKAIAGVEKLRTIVPSKSRWLIDTAEKTRYEAKLKQKQYPYFVGAPGVSIAALVTVIMTVNNPMDNAEVMAALKQLGFDDATIAEYKDQGIPPARQTESMLKYLYNNPRTFEIAA